MDQTRSERRLATGADGALTLLMSETDPASGLTRWWAMTTSGPRTIVFRSGTVAHDGNEDTKDQTLTRAMSAISGRAKGSSEARAASMARLAAAMAQDPEAEDFARFFGVCGRATFDAVRHGIPLDRLVEMDAACGRHRIDGLFAEWPFLLPLLAPLREASSSSGDVSAALATVSAAQDTVPGLAAALVDLSARLRPVETFGAARYGEDRGGNDDHEEDEHYEDFEDPRAAFDAEYGRPGPERIGPAPRSVPGQPGEPSRVAVLLKRMRRKQVKPAPTSGLVPLLALAAAVPPDWLPGDAASYAAFAVVAGLFRPLVVDSAGALSLDVLVSSSKGRWPEFLARIGSVAAAGAVHDVKDMAAAFRRQVVAPALMHAMSRHAGSALDAPALHRLVVAAAQRAAADGNGRYWMMRSGACCSAARRLPPCSRRRRAGTATPGAWTWPSGRCGDRVGGYRSIGSRSPRGRRSSPSPIRSRSPRKARRCGIASAATPVAAETATA